MLAKNEEIIKKNHELESEVLYLQNFKVELKGSYELKIKNLDAAIKKQNNQNSRIVKTLNHRIENLSQHLDEAQLKVQKYVQQNLKMRTRFGVQNMEEFENGTEDIQIQDENALIVEKKVQQHIQNELKLIGQIQE